MRQIVKGSTSQSLYLVALDSTSTTGGRKTGLVFNSSGLTAYYVRNGATSTAITLATLASASAAWSSGGFVEVDATNTPGLYRLDVPDAAFATGVDSVEAGSAVVSWGEGICGRAAATATALLNEDPLDQPDTPGGRSKLKWRPVMRQKWMSQSLISRHSCLDLSVSSR